MSPRTGRPKTSNPMKNDVKVRLNDELHEKLLLYCEKNGTTKAETIRKAVSYFLEKQM